MPVKTVLLTNHFLQNFTGSELALYDLAREFLDLNFEVYVAAFQYADPLKSFIDELDVHVLDMNKPLNKTFDVLWAQHFTTADACLADGKVKANTIVFSSLSPYMPIESPPLYVNDLSVILANSKENGACLLEMGIPKEKIAVFPNPVRREFFEKKRTEYSPILKRLAVVSNHIPDEVWHAVHSLRKRHVAVDVYGAEAKAVYITPEVLSRYDAVVSIGRTVQYCLVMGIPVYCYDHFGGPGYVDMHNKEKAAEFNFSGRCTNVKKSAEIIVDELTGMYKAVLAVQEPLTIYALENYNLSSHVQNVIGKKYDGLPPLEGAELAELFYRIHFRQIGYVKETEKKYNDLLASASWKVTVPLRRMKEIVSAKIRQFLRYREG